MNKPLIVTVLASVLVGVPTAVACWTPPTKPCEPKREKCQTTTTTTTSTVPTTTTTVTTPEPPPATTTAPVPPTAPEPPATSPVTPSEPTPAVLPPKAPVKRYTCASLPKGAGAKWRTRLGCKASRNPVRVCPPGKPFKATVRGKRVCLASRPNPTPVAVAG